MGFQRPSYKLTFEDDPAFKGLEVFLRSPSMNALLELEKAYPRALAQDVDAQVEIMRLMTRMIISWNLEEDDETPVPVSFESVMEQPYPMVMAIIDAWREKIAGVSSVPPPLPNGSGNGQASPDGLQIPMTPLTEGLPS